MFRVCHVFLPVHCSLLVTSWEMAVLLVLLYVMFYHIPGGVLSQAWCLFVSIPDLCPLSYFLKVFSYILFSINLLNFFIFFLHFRSCFKNLVMFGGQIALCGL